MMKRLAFCLLAGCASGAPAMVDEDGGAEPAPVVVDAATDRSATAPPTPTPTKDAAEGVPDVAPPPSGWWNPAWHKRARLTITDPELKETLSDFQVAVKLEAPAFEAGAAKSDGGDLRFVADDGTVLDHELDLWNPAGASLVWLRLPKLAPGATVVHVYYANPDAPVSVDPPGAGVWPEPYAGVWHLSGSGKDSTPHGFDGAMMAGGAFTEGRMGKA
jgi:hypothetical protein